MADFFISYTSSDREWAHWIAKELQALDHIAHVHEWEIERGGDIYGWMEKRLEAADHVLCVVSDEYLKAPYSTLERNAALWGAATNRPGFVLFVAVKRARIPTLADHIKRCELFGLDEETARVRFREFIQKPATPETIFFPGQVSAVSNVPLQVPVHFLGRDEALAAIEEAFSRNTSGLSAAALYGLRGVGKTTLAAAFAERHRGDYRATWWVRAQTDASLRADLAALAVRLRWAGADEKEDDALAIALERLRHEGDGILLIFDNARDSRTLKPFLPRGGKSKILVTSNTHAWRDIAAPVQIGPWPKNVGADYLVARTGREAERDDAERLSEALGGLPLAHEQAAAYCERLEKAFAEYRKRFEAAAANLLDDARDAPAEYHDRLTVGKAFALAIEEAAKLYPAAESLIVHTASLAPEPVPLFLFAEGREKFGAPLDAAMADDGLDEAVAALRTFALIERQTIGDERDPSIQTETIRLHRLVRQIAAGRCPREDRERMQATLIGALTAVYPRDISEANSWAHAWPRARRLDPLAMALLETPPQSAEEDVGRLLDGVAAYRHHALGAYQEARPLYERSLAVCERRQGPDHPDTAERLNNLALLIRDEGNLEAARPLFERALAINEKVFGSEHAATVTSLNNLALLLRDQGDLAAARTLFQRALSGAEKAAGPMDPITAGTLSNLGLVLQAEGDAASARALFERALAIDEKALGADHPFTAMDLSNLALLLKEAGDLAGARTLHERALAIEEKALGPDHPHTAATLSNLAELLHEQGELNLARPLYERALAIHKRALRPDHQTIAVNLNNLATLLRDAGDLAAARPLLEQALASYERALGPEHPATNRVRCNLAKVLASAGCAADAYNFAAAALAAHDASLGPSHRWTLDSAAITAQSLELLERNDEAIELRQRYGVRGDQAAANAATS